MDGGGLLSPIMPGGPAYARYLTTTPIPTMGVSAFLDVARVRLNQIEVPWPVVIDRLIYKVGAVSAGNVRIGLYRRGAIDTPAAGVLIAETASVAQLAADCIQMITVPDTLLTPGQYYIGIMPDDATGSFALSYDSATTLAYIYDRGGGYGAFTNPCPGVAASDRVGWYMMRVKTNLGL